MSTQLKHAGDPAATDNKPGDRRRGAAGRAAALRRAPSDSDCSGETASLSADSGERRPPPPPPRSGKTRSRRRGSEWEVLEGLKDGQRFERRPEVFNGFLHKKRKWPLKGWHKRFFVVDGGILVYARSPTDVARGRLHGSLDVGLSVISAKPRRRRIDIDADEFIYHLRAKTPDVFRTWLNVLKAHRLYRQHLLTFGARESVPKIHAPLDDLPPTDTSSRVSQSSIESFSSLTQSQSENPKSSFQFPSSEITSSVYDNKSQCSVIKRWKGNQSSSLIPFEASNFSNSKPFDVPETHNMRGSLCSMHCVVKKPSNLHNSYKALPDIPLCDEKQMISTDLDFVTLQSNSLGSDSIYESIVNNFNVKTMTGPTKSTPKPAERMLNESVTTYNDVNGNSPLWRDNKEHAVYCFSQKHRHRSRSRRRGDQWTMKRSRKCTNLVKYKNMTDEPRLAKPLLRQMILCKYRLNVGTRNLEDACVWCDFTKEDKVDKSTQDSVSLSEYDRISEKLIFNLFDTPEDNVIKSAKARRSSLYVNQVVKELYDLNISESKKHPIKFLFKSLLQYFLKNTQGKFRGSILRDVATNRPSNTYFSRDKEVSFPNFKESTESRTQSTQDTQFIEEFIKSNIYYSSTGRGSSVETDIKITRTLIDNLDTSSTKFVKEGIQDKVTDSSELSKLQEFIKHLVSETSLSKAVAKDFLNAYLCVLGCGSKSISSLESSPSLVGTNGDPICDIQTECVQKKISKSISVNDGKSSFKVDIVNSADQGKLDFKVITDGFNNGVNNMMGLFTNKVGVVNNEQDINDNSDNTVSDNKSPAKTELKSEGLKSTKTLEALEHEMLEEDYNSNIPNTIVIDLSSYDVKNVLMSKDDTVVDTTLLAIDLKDKSDSDDSKLKRLSLKFNNANPTPTEAPNAINTAKNKTNPIYQVHMRSNNPFLGKNWKKNDEFEIEKLFTALKASKENCSDQSFNRSLNTTRCSRSSCSNKDSDQCDFLSSIQEGMSYPNKKNNLTNFIPGFFTPQTWKQKKTEPEIVGLDFFFRVLKKLVALSKDIPSIHKEINILYWKLKTTHETAANGHSRANVLGDIYGININRESLSSEVPMDLSMYPDINQNIRNKAVEIAINTSFIYPKLHNGLDKALSAGVFGEMLTNISVQTLSIDIGADRANAIDNFANIYAYKVEEKKKTYSKDEWLRSITEEYVKTDAIKCMLKKYHHLPQSIRVTHPIKAKAKIPDVTAPPNSSLMIEFSSISPPLTISNRSQNSMKADVYELFKRTKSKLIRSESMTMSSLFNAKSDVSNDLKTLYRCSSEPSYCSGLISPNAGTIRGPQAGFVSGTPGGRLAGWIVESGGPLESASRELGQAQLSVQQLQRLLDAMLELQHQLHHDTDVSLEGASPNVKKDRRKFGLRKKKSNSKCASVELAPPHMDPSSSHMALSALTAPPSPGGGSSSMPNSAASLPMACAAARPQSLPGAEALGVGPSGGPTSLTSLTPDHQLREDFTILAKDLVANLKTVVSTLVVERGRLRAAMESAEVPPAGGVVAALRTNLTSALQQNSELRTRLSRIHDASDLAEISSVGNNSDQVTRPFPQSLSYSSSCVSASEFFDAEEHEDELKPAEIIATDEAGVIELDGDSSSEAGSLSSEEGSASSDNSDGATSAVIPAERTPLQNGSETICSRRLRLPCPRPTPASPSLWNLLYKNIGKDLSQISMPVTINEPLNMLQRLCEELEYSSLLDSAASCTNELERMSLVAAFAVSAYAASAHRAASKPFNPLLAETYECIRDDRDFRFLAEQVSHHPPISACHAESPRWTFWQEARIKTKFWGKSMEFQPTGRVHVRLSPSGDHYSWNKVTTCVHNLFGGQRWVDQYGDMHIACHGTEITCKLQFIKASSWSSSRHEVRGVVAVGGAPRMRLQGRWSDGLQAGDRTLWRPGAMPADYELYYGFTRFAMELNELEPGMRDILPSTDTRLRPDQRALEEGDVDAAEQFKHELEQAQRERRRDGVEHTARWFRKTIEEGEETWVFTGEYWKAREAGFIDTPRLW